MAPRVFSYIFFFSFHLYIIYAHFYESSHENSASPMEFLNKLSGIKKGDHGKGVNELKKYLLYLGYMDYDTDSDNCGHQNENIFDEFLELALQKYQTFYDLNITGALDSATISKLSEPRCGLPDFYNPNKSRTPFHIISRYSFFPGQPKWKQRRLKYAFNKFMKEETIPPLEHALKEWASSTPFRFIRVKNLNEADIRISFMRGYHGDGQPFIGPDAGLAHTFAPPDGRIHFDAAQNWSPNVAKDTYDIQTVGLHELGHALGLGHSRMKEAAMYPIVNSGERKGLHEDDINGIKALYKL